MTFRPCVLIAVLFIFTSCISSNEETISSFGGQVSELEATASYDIFPFTLVDYSMSPAIDYTQALTITISGNCRGLMNQQLALSGGEEDQDKTPEGVGVDSQGFLASGPDGFLYRSDIIKDISFSNSTGNQTYYPGTTNLSTEAYASILDCQNSGQFKFTMVAAEEFSEIITNSCSQNIPFKFQIHGVNANGDNKTLYYRVQLSREQCERVNPCDESFHTGTGSYKDETEINNLKRLLTANIVGNITETQSNAYTITSSYPNEKMNNPLIVCNPDQLFNSVDNGYSEKMSTTEHAHADLYLFNHLDGGDRVVRPIGEDMGSSMKANFHGFGHVIENFVIRSTPPARPGGTASLFHEISYDLSDLEIKDFKLQNNEFQINPGALTENPPGLGLIGSYNNSFIAGSTPINQKLEDIELYDNDIYFLAPLSSPSFSYLGCSSSEADCLIDFYLNNENLNFSDSLLFVRGNNYSQLQIHFDSIKASGNRFHFYNANGDFEYLFDLREY